jgi:hypothetical protein
LDYIHLKIQGALSMSLQIQTKLILSASVLMLTLLNLFGCSVYKAASNDGVSVSDVKGCQYKASLLAKGMERVDTKEHPDGKVTETYRAKARKNGLNYVRAAGHGAMDVITLGLWEVVGTPVEGAISNNRHYIIAKATYPNKTTEEIEQLEIFDANGKKVH